MAADTWARIPLVRKLQLAFGEETFTDLLLLDLMLRAGQRGRILPSAKPVEAIQGTDWEWWIGSDALGWVPYAVQAKRISRTGTRYASLTHKVGGTPQIDLLERYALAQQSFPIYCFYNSVPLDDVAEFWHCGLMPEQAPQLGCTVVPLEVARKAIAKHGGKNFEFIHGHEDALPWRCLVSCPWIAAQYFKNQSHGLLERPDHEFFAPNRLRPRALPESLARSRDTGETIERATRLDDLDLTVAPRRIVLLEADAELREGWERARPANGARQR